MSRGDMIRTCDLLVPNQALCQAELRPDESYLVSKKPIRGFRFDRSLRYQRLKESIGNW